MKRLATILFALLPALSLHAQQPQAEGQTSETKKFRLHVFGSEYSGPTNAFLKDVEGNSELKKRLSELDYSYLDGDNIDAKQNEAYRFMLLFGTRQYPIFIISDLYGNVYKASADYSSAEKLLEWLDAEDLASREIMVRSYEFSEGKLRKMARRQKKTPFIGRLLNSPWGLGVEGGVSFSNLAGSETFTGYKTGYYVNLHTALQISRRARIQGGLTLNSLGGKTVGLKENVRLDWFSLPVEIVFKPRFFSGMGHNGLMLGAGGYGSHLLSLKTPAGMDTRFGKWDAGVRLRLVLQQGTYSLSAGWMRGFVDLTPGPGKAYNNAFQVGLAMTLGY